MTSLIFALPSKGRLQEQAASWLADAGYRLTRRDGERGYAARLDGAPGVDLRLLSAREIALGLDSGELHLGVTGEDLLREVSADPDGRMALLRGLGYGRADLVVATPRAWLDVDDMADLGEVAARLRHDRGAQLRVATKYVRQTRRFFANHGIVDYRIVESHGATEGAPAAGQADLIVDITSSGATLAANHLKILTDGLILRSEAQLTASLRASWGETERAALSQLLGRLEARRTAQATARLLVAERVDLSGVTGCVRAPDGTGWLVLRKNLDEVFEMIGKLEKEQVVVGPVDYVFSPENPIYDKLIARLSQEKTSTFS